MAVVTGLTAARMLLIEGASIVNASISSFVLTLTRQNGTTINLGNIRGSTGATGATGPTGAPGLGNIQTVNGITDPNPVLTAANVGAVPASQVATTTVQGIIEIATTTEVAARSDVTRAVVPGYLINYPGIPWAIAAGKLATRTVAAGTSELDTVTFPASRFSVAPVVTFAAEAVATNIQLAIESLSATSMVVRRTNNEPSTARAIVADWIAIQMTGAAAAG